MREAKAETILSLPMNISGATGCEGGRGIEWLSPLLVTFACYEYHLPILPLTSLIVTLQVNVRMEFM
jgi:hypothetical protein